MTGELPAQAASQACERLARSRERLQLALLAQPARPAGAAKDLLGRPLADWRDGFKSIPGFGLLLELATGWWARHPYRLVTSVVSDVASAAVLPTAQRHPVGLVTGAFLVGGLLAWSRPWRLLTPALFAALLARAIAPPSACQSAAPSRPVNDGATGTGSSGPAGGTKPGSCHATKRTLP